MFFQIFIRGNLRLWWQGNMPHNLRQLWRKRHWWGADPVLRSVLTHVFFTISAVTFLSFSARPVMVAAGINPLDVGKWFTESWIPIFFVCVLSLFGGVISTMEVSERFYYKLLDTKEYLKLSFHEIDALSLEGISHHAGENLRNSGKKLRDAEIQFPSFHPEIEKLRRDFKDRYATFLALGIVEDVGYSSFIPPKPPK